MSEPDGLVSRQLHELERLIGEMEQGPESPARARARAIVAAVLELHAEALRRMTASDPARLDAWARDSAIAAVLLLHGLHPVDLEARVRRALDELRPALQEHGARIAVVTISVGGVHVRLARDRARGGVAPAVLRAWLADAIVAVAPDASAIEIEGPEASSHLVPLEDVRLRPRPPKVQPG